MKKKFLIGFSATMLSTAPLVTVIACSKGDQLPDLIEYTYKKDAVKVEDGLFEGKNLSMYDIKIEGDDYIKEFKDDNGRGRFKIFPDNIKEIGKKAFKNAYFDRKLLERRVAKWKNTTSSQERYSNTFVFQLQNSKYHNELVNEYRQSSLKDPLEERLRERNLFSYPESMNIELIGEEAFNGFKFSDPKNTEYKSHFQLTMFLSEDGDKPPEIKKGAFGNIDFSDINVRFSLNKFSPGRPFYTDLLRHHSDDYRGLIDIHTKKPVPITEKELIIDKEAFSGSTIPFNRLYFDKLIWSFFKNDPFGQAYNPFTYKVKVRGKIKELDRAYSKTFQHTHFLDAYTIDDDCKVIEEEAFKAATFDSLTSIEAKEIEDLAFSYAHFKEPVTIETPTLKGSPFFRATFDKGVTLTKKKIFAPDFTNSKGAKRNGAFFENATINGPVIFEYTVEEIGPYAFMGATLPDGFDIPDTIKAISPTAFVNAENISPEVMKKIKILSSGYDAYTKTHSN